jgi:chromosome segregation ATPase
MKATLIFLLSISVIILGISFSALQKELVTAKKSAAFYEKRSDDLQRELARVNRACAEKERFLSEIEGNIEELESRIQLETLERYLPKKTWAEIKPIIDRLKALQAERGTNNPSRHNEEDY